MRPQKQVSRETLLRWWSLLIRGAIGLAVINFAVALVVRVAGGNLHPLFADPSTFLTRAGRPDAPDAACPAARWTRSATAKVACGGWHELSLSWASSAASSAGWYDGLAR